jgi:glycosyltransferase involved in cell wall biosynthesis
MPAVYRAADVFVLPSLLEMLGNAVLEAMATGLPCIRHREPVSQWILGDCGTTVDMTVPGELARAVAAFRSPERRAEAAARARAQAVDRFSKPVVLAQHVAMYREVLRG